jgi:alkanesulfonate monooxygenase SsuD/methylene tetrahydromethanopterin reductase-like flavin-dependent oxidoreductase (luciferase family)
MRFGVGLFSLQSTAMQPAHWAGAYREMREYATLMEELGYDELWLSEHHFFYDGYCPALLPAAASVFSDGRAHVGTGILLLPMQDPHGSLLSRGTWASGRAAASTWVSASATATSSLTGTASVASSACPAC